MSLDKTFNATEAEGRIYTKWEEAEAFAAGANASRAESFCVMIPPPNVTGSLHIGHAFNNTLQDILVRWHRMRGFDTLWQPGQDHAGIATQMVVERALAEAQEPSRTEMGRAAFIERVWAQKEKSGGTIIDQLKRLGASCDWSRNAFTMDPNFHDAVIKTFVDLYNQGVIYRGKRLVNWDPHFETAISDLEVENIEVDGHMWHFKYPLAGGETYTYIERDEDGAVILKEERDYISIATTRPETMLGDGAVAVHPSDERYAPIIGKLCEIPVGPKEHRRLIPIIADEYPDPNFGSGAVKITGAHDFNDYAVAKRGNIPCYRLMDTKGAMRADGAAYAEEAAKAQAIIEGKAFTEAEIDAINLVPDAYRGLDRFEARKRVIADITAEGLAVMQADEEGTPRPVVEAKKIMQPFGDRSKVVIEPMLTDQWFVDTAQIVGPALKAVKDGTVKITPESGEKVYYHWLENIEPWCISRQLWWGHQIPVWYGPRRESDDQEGFKSFCAASDSEIVRIAKNYYGEGIEIELQEEGTFVAGHLSWENQLSKVYLFQDPDVLDTWFSSGLWPIGTLGWPEETEALERYFPTSTLITGQDILFFWVARMMMMQLAVLPQDKPVSERVPFKEVYLHGLVRDAKGKKMSKSIGNVVDPLEVIDEYGADALRFSSAAMAALGGSLKLDMERIKGYRNFGTKLWNFARFAEMNGVFEVQADALPAPKETLNRWIMGETARALETVDAALAQYRFNDAANALYAFVWGKVCDWYVEFSKPLLQEDHAAKSETQETMKWVLDQCLILLHPIMPFITEELWGRSGARAKMLVHADWPTYQSADLIDADADHEMTWVIALIESIRSARQQMHVPVGARIPMLFTELSETGQAAWARNEMLIKRLARIESLTEVAELPKGTVTVPAEGANFGLPLADVIDVAAEKNRLQKSLDKLAKEIGGLNGRLNNPKFASSAPEEIVEETRDNLAARQEEAAKLEEALSRLSELG